MRDSSDFIKIERLLVKIISRQKFITIDNLFR